MGKVILYIASSIDGFIARENGSLDWLDNVPNPNNTDHGYTAFLTDVETIIMGRKTYDTVIGFGIDWPYANKTTYVVSRNSDLKLTTPNTYVLTSDLEAFVTELKQSGKKNCWLVGGGDLNSYFFSRNLIDSMILSIAPVVLGQGISLIGNKTSTSNWTLIKTEQYETGIITLTYDKN